ncbi:MAG: 16S rRNA (uracil(1498)-N(3))-methyltransferase [Woeseiaceae bacterium]|nr:16S rRNA (uracil(1498)-N(3))-methyltransferase [Woeseiaceae bacterium]NIP20470.1 16S rRNA (uracil(1498)-N(3))-methyltransferase [Woeseiaceae bacterium]NIS89065.1 16S rRNA (uracil(1498)-N(3))-methyltransferase [Woeseiaceae bacterium]
MPLTRLFVNSTLSAGADLRLEKDQARYLGRVLRLGHGDTLRVFNGDDGEFHATISKITKDSVAVHVVSPIEAGTESPLKIHLVQGISRGERMDFVVQKATELGVKRITPVLSQYGVVKLDKTRAGKRQDHWQSVAESACEQSGRIRPPLIDEVIALNTWFGARPAEAGTDLILRPGAINSLASIPTPATKVCLLIGPEGGFSDSEYDDAQVAGFQPVALGPRVLRTETAALAAISVAQSLWGDLAS